LFNSGVVLHKPPFNLKFKSFKKLLNVNIDDDDSSIVETVLYEL